jgi:hypothetical protein
MPDVTISVHCDLFGQFLDRLSQNTLRVFFSFVSFASLSVLSGGRGVFNDSISPRSNLV